MSRIKVEEVDNNTEELLLAGAISNTSYITWLKPRYDKRFVTNEQIRLLLDLILEYYDINVAAPMEAMHELFESVVQHLDEDEAVICERLLSRINQKYAGRELAFNVLSEMTDDYFEVRSVEVLSDQLSGLVKRGKTVEAQNIVSEWHNKPSASVSKSVSVFDDSFSAALLESQNIIHRFDNALDYILPKQCKNKFYTFLGGTKSGKSQWLGWLATEFLRSGLKVAMWEFELQRVEILHRLTSAITGKLIDGTEELSEIPSSLSVFDCAKNRSGTCENPLRPDNGDLDNFNLWEDGIWEPCTVCRGSQIFEPVVWKMPYTMRNINTIARVKKEMKMWRRQYGDNLRVFTNDPGTKTVTDIKNDIKRLQLIEGFIPDVLIIDHADNIAPERRYGEKRHELSNIWLDLSTVAKHGYLLWTASQTNRTGWYKEWISADMIGESADKLMITDGVVTINQWKSETIDEYYWNTQRLRAAYFRSQKIPSKDVKVLHDFSRYIACLDCEIM